MMFSCRPSVSGPHSASYDVLLQTQCVGSAQRAVQQRDAQTMTERDSFIVDSVDRLQYDEAQYRAVQAEEQVLWLQLQLCLGELLRYAGEAEVRLQQQRRLFAGRSVPPYLYAFLFTSQNSRHPRFLTRENDSPLPSRILGSSLGSRENNVLFFLHSQDLRITVFSDSRM